MSKRNRTFSMTGEFFRQAPSNHFSVYVEVHSLSRLDGLTTFRETEDIFSGPRLVAIKIIAARAERNKPCCLKAMEIWTNLSVSYRWI